MNTADIASFIVLQEAARNTYTNILVENRESQLKAHDSIIPQNKKHEKSLMDKRRYIINSHEKTMKGFDKFMKGLVDNFKTKSEDINECMELAVDMIGEFMSKTIYKDENGFRKVYAGRYLLEHLRQKLFEEVDRDGNNLALNHGQVIIRIPAAEWEAEHGDFKNVTVRVIDGQKFVEL